MGRGVVDDGAVVDVGLGDRVMPVKVAIWPGTSVVVAPEQVPIGFDRLWHVAVTPPAGRSGRQ